MSTLVTSFIYGWVAGIIGVVLFILYGFDTLLLIMRLPKKVWSRLPFGRGRHEDVLSNAADVLLHRHMAENKSKWLAAVKKSKRSLREQGLEGIVTSTTAKASQLKLASTCTVSWYEDGVSGAPVRCRFVLSGSELTVYELLPSRGGFAGHDGADADESAKKSDHKGKKRSDGGEGEATAAAEHLRGITDISRLEVKLIKRASKEKSKTSNPFRGRILVLSTVDNQPVVGPRDTAENSVGGSGSTTPRTFVSPSPSRTPVERSIGGTGESGGFSGSWGLPVRATHLSRRGMSAWTCVVVKFRDNRETERWNNVLRGLREANAWREYAKSLPNPDTANTLIARFLFQNMQGEGLAKAIAKQVQKKLKKVSATKFPRDLTGEILLDDFVIGNSIPWISEVSEPTVSTSGEFGFDFNLHYKGEDDGFTLYFRLALAYRDIRIPHVIISLKLHELEASVHVSIGPPPSKKFWIAGCQPPVLRVEVHQGCAIGGGLLHRILTSLPDLSGIVTNLLKLYFISDMVLPYMDDFPLPNFEEAPKVPSAASPKNTFFDRKRAAEKSAAPDLPFATTDIDTTTRTEPAPANSLAATTSHPQPQQQQQQQQQQHQSLNGEAAGTGTNAGNASSSFPTSGGFSHGGVGSSGRIAAPLWASAVRRRQPHNIDIDIDINRNGEAAAKTADSTTAFAHWPDATREKEKEKERERERGGSQGNLDTAATGGNDAEEAATSFTSSSKGQTESSRHVRRSKLLNLKSILKSKGADMGRAAVAKANKPTKAEKGK